MWRRRAPDDLTAREHEVLHLIRIGLTNDEIAARLGITVAGAKYHVSQILSKLGVATREEAAAVALGERRRWWAGWQLWAKIASAATVAAAVAGLALLAWGVVKTNGPGVASTSQLKAEPTPVPWIDGTPAPLASPKPLPTIDPAELAARQAIRACGTGEVAVEYEGRNGAMMSIFSFYGFRNRSDSPCRLEGPPQVRLLDSSRAELPSSVTRGAATCPDSSSFCIEEGPIVLAAESSDNTAARAQPRLAGITLVWRNFDIAAQIDCGSPKVTTLRFVFAGELAYDAAVPNDETMAPCRGAVSIWAFRSAPTPTPVPPPPHELAAELVVPGKAVAGQRLEFIVEVTNESASEFKFASPCPNYIVLLGERKEARAYHMLNCSPVGSIPPGATISFDMVIDVPNELTPGSHRLTWLLELPGTIPDEARADVTIETP